MFEPLISIGALLVAILSLIVTMYTTWNDNRDKIEITFEYGHYPAQMEVESLDELSILNNQFRCFVTVVNFSKHTKYIKELSVLYPRPVSKNKNPHTIPISYKTIKLEPQAIVRVDLNFTLLHWVTDAGLRNCDELRIIATDTCEKTWTSNNGMPLILLTLLKLGSKPSEGNKV